MEIELARTLNRLLGTTVLTPWSIGAVPDVDIALVMEAVNLKAAMEKAGIA
jgi:hypothetical protein